MAERKWENLNQDCLVNIFGRLDVESLLLDVPLVCKQWYQATLNPFCWQKLVFPVHIYRSSRLAGASEGSISDLIKFVVGRSLGCATVIELPSSITRKDLILISDTCRNLKVLAVPTNVFVDRVHRYDVGYTISELIVNWRTLEVLKLHICAHMVQIIANIGLYCNNFAELCVLHANIDREIASAIASNLSTIKRLVLDEAYLEKGNLQLIQKGCRELELLYVRKCVGFDEDDEEILMMASRIKDFRCDGSSYVYICDYDYDDSGDYIFYGGRGYSD